LFFRCFDLIFKHANQRAELPFDPSSRDHEIPLQKVRDKRGRSPLHLAAVNGRARLVLRLLEVGADAEAADEEGVTPLHLAVASTAVPIVKMLLMGITYIEVEFHSRILVY